MRPDDLEAVPLVERDVARVGRFEIGRHAVAVADRECVIEQRAAQALALMLRIDADQRQVPVRLARDDSPPSAASPAAPSSIDCGERRSASARPAPPRRARRPAAATAPRRLPPTMRCAVPSRTPRRRRPWRSAERRRDRLAGSGQVQRVIGSALKASVSVAIAAASSPGVARLGPVFVIVASQDRCGPVNDRDRSDPCKPIPLTSRNRPRCGSRRDRSTKAA